MDQIGVARKGLGRCDILDAMLLPQSAGVAKRVDAAFGRHARAGQDDDIPDVAQSLNSVCPELVEGPFFLLWRRSEEHTSELQSLMRISYAVFCLKKKTTEKSSERHTQRLNKIY